MAPSMRCLSGDKYSVSVRGPLGLVVAAKSCGIGFTTTACDTSEVTQPVNPSFHLSRVPMPSLTCCDLITLTGKVWESSDARRSQLLLILQDWRHLGLRLSLSTETAVMIPTAILRNETWEEVCSSLAAGKNSSVSCGATLRRRHIDLL